MTNPVGPRARRPFHEKEVSGGAVRIPLHDHRPIFDVRKQRVGDVRVVLQQIAFRQPKLGPEDLPQIGQAHFALADGKHHVVLVARDRQRRLGGHGGASFGGRGPWRTAPATARMAARCLRPRAAAAARRGSCRRGRRSPRERPAGSRKSGAARPRISATQCCRGARLRSRQFRVAAPSRFARAGAGRRDCPDRCPRPRIAGWPPRVTLVSGLRSPAFVVMTCTPVPTTGLSTSGGAAKCRA